MQFYRVILQKCTFVCYSKLRLAPGVQTFEKLKNKDDLRKWLSFDLLMVTLMPVIYHIKFILFLWMIWPVDLVTKYWVISYVFSSSIMVLKQTDVFGLHEVCLSQKSWQQWGWTGCFSVPGPRLFIINTREGNHQCDPLLMGLIATNLGTEYRLSHLHFLAWFIFSPVFGPLLVLKDQMFWGQLSLFCSCKCAIEL